MGNEDLSDEPSLVPVTLDKNGPRKLDVGLTLGNAPDGNGVIVVRVKKDSLADNAGLRRGNVILMINEHRVGTHAEAVTLIDRSARGIVRLGLRPRESKSGVGPEWDRSSRVEFAMAG